MREFDGDASRLKEVIEAVRARRGDDAAETLFDAGVVLDVMYGLAETTREAGIACEAQETCFEVAVEAFSRLLGRLDVDPGDIVALGHAFRADIDDMADD